MCMNECISETMGQYFTTISRQSTASHSRLNNKERWAAQDLDAPLSRSSSDP